MVLGGDIDFDSILENIFFGGGGGGVEDGVDTFFGECDVVDITYVDGFNKICFGDDNNIFLGECGGGGGGVGGADTLFGEGECCGWRYNTKTLMNCLWWYVSLWIIVNNFIK